MQRPTGAVTKPVQNAAFAFAFMLAGNLVLPSAGAQPNEAHGPATNPQDQLLLVGGWTDEPPAWERPSGRPLDPVIFQRDRSFCRGQVSSYFGREWVAAFTRCMQHLGYVPLRRDVFR